MAHAIGSPPAIALALLGSDRSTPITEAGETDRQSWVSSRPFRDTGVVEQETVGVVDELAAVVEARCRVGVAPLRALVVHAEVALLEPLDGEVGSADVGGRRLGLLSDVETQPADRQGVGQRRRLEVDVDAAGQLGADAPSISQAPAPSPSSLTSWRPDADRPTTCALRVAHVASTTIEYRIAQGWPSSTTAACPSRWWPSKPLRRNTTSNPLRASRCRHAANGGSVSKRMARLCQSPRRTRDRARGVVTIGGMVRFLVVYETPSDPAAFDRHYREVHHTACQEAAALLLCTPEYAGALPGALKNLLESTVGDAGTYGKPVAWINASGPAAPTGAADAHTSLRKVLAYVGADVVDAACARIPLTRDAVGPDGTIADPELRGRIADVLTALASHACAVSGAPER